MGRGFFLSLDGIDGTGKSTQCRLLADWLRHQGLTVVSCIDPGGTPLGQDLRSLLLHHRQEMTPTTRALLFMASRAQLTASVIRPALEAGQVIVSDRFLLANLAYQGHGDGLDPDQLRQAEWFATNHLEPDLTLILDLPVELARARRERPADTIESRDQAYHERVRQGFLCEARRQPDRIRVIDASGTIEEVQEWIREAIAQRLPLLGAKR